MLANRVSYFHEARSGANPAMATFLTQSDVVIASRFRDELLFQEFDLAGVQVVVGADDLESAGVDNL